MGLEKRIDCTPPHEYSQGAFDHRDFLLLHVYVSVQETIPCVG